MSEQNVNYVWSDSRRAGKAEALTLIGLLIGLCSGQSWVTVARRAPDAPSPSEPT